MPVQLLSSISLAETTTLTGSVNDESFSGVLHVIEVLLDDKTIQVKLTSPRYINTLLST